MKRSMISRKLLVACISSTIVLLLFGCAVAVKDYYPEHTRKGYALLQGAFCKDISTPVNVPLFQYVDGRVESLGYIETAGIVDWISTRNRLVASPPGKAIIYFNDVSQPLAVDIYECQTTRVSVAVSTPPKESNRALYDLTFEISDPVKGKYQVKGAR